LVSGTNPFLRRIKIEPGEADQKEFFDAVTRAITLCDGRLLANPKDTEALYVQGVSFGLRSNYNFLVRKAWMDSLKDATRARKAHARVSELDPGNVDALMVPALHEYVVGSLPWYMKVLGFLTGYRGDKDTGIRLLERVVKEGDRNRDNARFLLCAVYRRERRAADAVPLVRELIRDFPRNYILRMELAQMYSDVGRKEDGLAVVAEMERLKNKRAPGYDRMPQDKIWYARGTLLFWYLDLDGALRDFRRMTAAEHDLNLNTAQLAWFRVGQIHDLQGRRGEAVEAYRKVIAYSPESHRAGQAKQYLRTPCTLKNRL
jgi:tetratricopeptide (TPR) repeat protein